MKVEPGEPDRLERLGLSVTERPQGFGFSLPCACHREERCAEYGARPRACRGYECKLLRRHLAGEITREEGLRRIEQVKRLVASIRGRIGAGDERSIWQQLRSIPLEEPDVDPELQMDRAALLTLRQRHFHIGPDTGERG